MEFKEYYEISNSKKTNLSSSNGKTIDVKVGDKIDFIEKNGGDKKIYQAVKKTVKKDIGKGPYKITGIVHLEKDDTTNLWIQGENGKAYVNKGYFTKYEN